ncbi:MAG: tetratricopeptide repeat protein, partial [Ignavibacteria bacterium]|nr:tetratricopeptide repeat protein [Ignavibacteria bacterium]
MRKCLLIILTFITLISCSKSPDELKKDSERFLNQALDYYERGYLSQSAELLEKVIEIEDKLGNLERKANCYIYLGLINYQISDFNKAKNNYQKALEIFRQRNDKKNELLVLNNIAGIYSILGKYNDAIKIYSDVLGKSLIFADKESEAIVSLNLGELYQELWDFEKSFDYFNRAYDAYEILGDVKGKLYTLKKISDLFILSKNYPNAIKTIDMAFELSKKNGVKYLTQEFYNNLGLIYFYENQVSKA